jgi:F0F1-type ATP synthase epsilon subunit
VLKKGMASEMFTIQGGFVEVLNNKATVLVEGVL